MELLKVAILFAVTAVAEIVGCDLPWLVVKQAESAWLPLPTALCMALFAWLLTLYPREPCRMRRLHHQESIVITIEPTSSIRTCSPRPTSVVASSWVSMAGPSNWAPAPSLLRS